MIFRTINDWKAFKNSDENKDLTFGFVPTMGALHEGHLSLVRRSQSENNKTVVSIFVNPTQFNDPEDFKRYPRDESADVDLLKSVKVDAVFIPNPSEIYNDQFQFQVHENTFSRELCGKFRPGHFDGVLTVVLKLLNIIEPTTAYFGQKDYQQFLLIKKMAESLFLNSKIVGLPTVRESDGLAMSSRNRLLTAEERDQAKLLPELLNSKFTEDEIKTKLEQNGFRVDYIERHFGRRFAAAHLGKVRLIDNVEI